MTLFALRCRSAVGQSVAAGCCAGATPVIQIRHFPAGGNIAVGTVSRVPGRTCAAVVVGTTSRAKAAGIKA